MIRLAPDHFSHLAMGVAALFVVLVAVAHVWFLGVFPLAAAWRARHRDEPLSPLAIGAALASVVFAAGVMFVD